MSNSASSSFQNISSPITNTSMNDTTVTSSSTSNLSSNPITNTAASPSPIKRPPVRLASAIEGFFAMMICLFMISYTKSLLIDIIISPYKDDIIGICQVFSIIIVTILLYGRRWRNFQLSPSQAWISVGKGFLQSWFSIPSLSLVWEWLLLIFLYSIQILIFGYLIVNHMQNDNPNTGDNNYLSSSSSSIDIFTVWNKLFTCGTSMSLIWAPIIEEFIFRVILFYVVLHRSGGNVGLACIINACTFGAIHLSNIYYNLYNIYSWLQMFGGILCGTAWTLLYALTGSSSLVSLLHISNNLAAITWLSYNIIVDPSKTCTDTDFTLELLVSMTIQIGFYIMVILICWRRLYSFINPSLQDSNITIPTEYPLLRKYNFKQLHPILYGDNTKHTYEVENIHDTNTNKEIKQD